MGRFLLLLLLTAAISFGQKPIVSDGGVVNAASFAGGQVLAPGSLVSIFGSELAAGITQADSIPLSNSLAGVSVMFNGIAAPMLFVSAGQINAQLPWDVLGGGGATSGTVSVVVTRGNTPSDSKQVQVGPLSPGIFAQDFTTGATGTGQAIAINTDGTLAAPEGSIPGLQTHPARIGDVILILGTGLGAVDGPIESGKRPPELRRTLATPDILIGGVKATQVPFSGLSPEFPGVNQINVVVPQGVQPGDAVPLQLQEGGITTTDKVTMAVRP
jgi:uncharacterized protein (TIGR03437 family)